MQSFSKDGTLQISYMNAFKGMFLKHDTQVGFSLLTWKPGKSSAQKKRTEGPDIVHFSTIWPLSRQINPKNTYSIDDILYLPPDKFCQNPFSGCREEVENVWGHASHLCT